MKNLFKLMLILFSTIIVGQPKTDSLSLKVDENTEKAILKETKYIDSIRVLKEKEIAKQDKMIKEKFQEKAMIKKANETKKYTVKTKKSNEQYVVKYGVKNDENGKAVYWEEIPRTWLGRQITGTEIRVREYYFDKGVKVYKD